MEFTFIDFVIGIFKSAPREEDNSAEYVPLSASNMENFVKNNEEKRDNGNNRSRKR